MSSRDIFYNNGVRADGYIITNRNRSEQLRAGANVDAVPDGWGAPMPAMPKTDRNAISEYNIVAKHSVAADHNVEGMLDYEAMSDTCFTRKFDRCQDFTEDSSEL